MLPAMRLAGRSTSWYVAVCALSLGVAGCGGGGPKLVDVTGSVIEDGKPVDNAMIQFNPSGSVGDSHPAEDLTGSEGTYKLTTRGRFGAAPGKYHVVITKLPPPPDPAAPNAEQFKDDPFMAALSTTPPTDGGGGAKKKKVDSSIEYNFDREVTSEGKQVFDFDLKSGTLSKKQGP